MLDTPYKVILRVGVASSPEYEDVAPILNGAGFYAFRRYPLGTDLSKIVTLDGRPAVRCYLAFIVMSPSAGGNLSRLVVKAWFSRRWELGRSLSVTHEPPVGHSDAPSPESVSLLARVRPPLDLDDVQDYFYDHSADIFLNADGQHVTGLDILREMYAKHCRTLGLLFRIRWGAGTAARWAIREGIWKGQDAAMWMLFKLYDIELVDKGEFHRVLFPFHKYVPADCRRVTEAKDGSHFFGFQSSRKSLVTNLVVVVMMCVLLYWKAPHGGLLRAIYSNTALTTVSLVVGFLIADAAGPWLLIHAISALSRFRAAVSFVIRKVNV